MVHVITNLLTAEAILNNMEPSEMESAEIIPLLLLLLLLFVVVDDDDGLRYWLRMAETNLFSCTPPNLYIKMMLMNEIVRIKNKEY